MVWTYWHAILDDSSAEVLHEVFDAYRALGQGAAPRFRDRPTYRDYIACLHEDWSARASAARGFWRERLRGVIKPTTLDGLQQRPAVRQPGAGHLTRRFRLSAATADMLRQLCAAHDLDPSALVHAAWAMVLGAFTGTDDVVFGEVRSCRHSAVPGANAIVGLLINTLPVRVRLSADLHLLALLRDLDDARAAAGSFDQTPLVEATAMSDIPGGARLFDTLVIVRDREDTRFKGAGLVARRFILHERTTFSVTVKAILARGAITLSFDRSRFDAAVARRMATLLKRLIHAMVARPGVTLRELPRLPAADLRALAAFNQTSVEVPSPGCVQEAVEAQVDLTPDAVALVCRGTSMTFRELDERANRVAAELVAYGIGPERTVGVFVDRSLEMVVGLLGILKAGGAYVPLDPTYPPERLRLMLEDTTPGVVLTTDRLRPALPPTAAPAVSLDALAVERRGERIRTSVGPDHLAYVIFTSGSSGRPKGVQVAHRNVINCFCGIDHVLGPAPGVWLALTGISFDISVLELFWTLARGFTVVVQEQSEHLEGVAAAPSGGLRTLFDFSLQTQVRRHGVTHLQCTPSLLERFVSEEGGLEALGALRHLLVGGEALPAALVEQLGPHLTGTLHNMYGPTETTIWSTTAVVAPGRPITIGRPLANTTVHIRDQALRPVPVGVPGELLIGGAGVARGYLSRPDLTAERFVHDAATGERQYRTGDRAAWRPDGQLVFLGRIDHQVKIRGHRVELDEIDNVISEHPAVRECVTLAQSAASGDVRLVAYVVPESPVATPPARSTTELAAAVRLYALTRLPLFMVPGAVVLLDAMPLTPNGKVDRLALAARNTARLSASGPLPESHRTRTIIAVMQELVGRGVGADDNFFDAGAHSLLLLQASARLGARLGHPVMLETMLAHPTARALATALADADAATLIRDRAEQRQNALRRRSERGPR
jgi:amino acid adenylation domain-containing protein